MTERSLPISTLFSLVSSRAFRDAPHLHFRCRNPNQCLPNFLKVLLLALPQIYTAVFHLLRSFDFNSGWGRDSCPYQPFFPLVSSRASRDGTRLRFRYRDPNQCLPNFLKMLLLTLPQIYTRVFHFLKSLDVDSAWVRDPCPYRLSFPLQVLARLGIHHTCVLRAGIPINAYLTF